MRPVFKTVFLFFCICTQLFAEEIIVVKTRSIPIIDRILTGFQSICADKHQLTVYDMQGNLHQGQEILSQIEDTIEKRSIQAIFTIGLPATQLIKQKITEIPIIFTMVNDPWKKGFTTHNMSGISKDLSTKIQLQTIKKTLPNAKNIAIIYSQKYSAYNAEKLAKAASKFQLNVKLYQVASVKEVPKTLRRVITENDAQIILPDRMVINQSSLEYFVTTVLENGFPTLSYNRHLVKSGMLMGLSPDYLTIGQQAGRLVCSDQHASQAIQAPEQFIFFVNSKTAKTIKQQLAPNLNNLADHVY